MKTYSYAARFEPADETDGLVVTFDDLPEAITQGDDMADARAMAEEALGMVLLTYLELGRPLPPAKADGIMVTPDPETSGKIAVIETFRNAGITRTELAHRMGKDEKEARRVLDPNVTTKLPMLTLALAAMGKKLVLGLEAAE